MKGTITINPIQLITKTPLKFIIDCGGYCETNIKSTIVNERLIINIDAACHLDSNNIKNNLVCCVVSGVLRKMVDMKIHNLPTYGDIDISVSNVILHMDGMVLNLFSFLEPTLVEQIKEPRSLLSLISGSSSYDFIKQSDLPTLDEDYEVDVILKKRRGENIYNSFKHGDVDGIFYSLSNDYKVSVLQDGRNYDTPNKIIHPEFITFIYGKYPNTTGDVNMVMERIKSRFQNFDIEIKFDKY